MIIGRKLFMILDRMIYKYDLTKIEILFLYSISLKIDGNIMIYIYIYLSLILEFMKIND